MMNQATPDSPHPQAFTLTDSLVSKLPRALAEAIKLAAIPYWFDEALLAALRGPADADGRTGKIFAKLIGFSFVSPVSEGRYTITADLRDLLRVRWTAHRAEFAAANQRAAEHLAARAGQAGGPQAEELEQARVYHVLGADGEAGIAALAQVFDAAEDTQRKAVAERLTAIAEEQRPFLAPAHQAWLDYFQARLHQLYGRWDTSRSALEDVLRQSELPPLLRARAQQALGGVLTRREKWVEAIQLYQQALDNLEEQADSPAARRRGSIMLDLGQAYVDLAVNVWGQRDPQPHLRTPASERALDWLRLVDRLPILVYLVVGLGPGVLRSVLNLVSGLDWMIARLFVSGAQWYKRAGAQLEAGGHLAGLARLQEHLARLYHSLGHLSGAAETYKRLLAQTDPPPHEYRRARAQLGLGHVRLDQGRPDEGAPLFEQALPALAAYDDTEYQARAHHLLGRAAAMGGQAEAALDHYRRALALYDRLGDEVGQTNVAHQLEEWAALPDTPAPLREQAAQVAGGVTRRYYLARYVHPALAAFRTVGLALLAVMLFGATFLSIRVRTNAELWTRTTVAVSALRSPSSAQAPEISPSSMQSLQISLYPDVAFAGIGLALGIYTLVYTGLGIYLLTRMPLRAVQEGQSQDYVLDARGLSRGHHTLLWRDVTGIVNVDRALGRRPMPAYSQTVVLGQARPIEIGGHTGWYAALSGELARRAPQAPRYALGYSVVFSLAGGVFAASLLSLAAFVILSLVWPELLGRSLEPLPYPVADLRVFSFIGLLGCLTWWLIVSPLRAEIFLSQKTALPQGRAARPRNAWPWIVLGVGVALTGVMFETPGAWRPALGLPGVIPSLYAASLVWIGAWAVWRSAAHPPALRPVVLLLVVLTTAPVTWTVGREMLAYNALMQGNATSMRARQIQAANPAGAEAEYLRAIDAYTRAIALSPRDAAAYAGRGVVYAQLGRLEEALADYGRSLDIAPRRPAVLVNRALISEALAERARRNGDEPGMQTAYKQAIADLTAAIELAPDTARYYVQRGVIYLTLGQRDQALADFQAAGRLTPDSPDVLNGLGWVNYELGRLALSEGDRDTARRAFEQAAQTFDRAVALDSQNLNNYSGQGWAYRELGDLERSRARGLKPNTTEASLAWQQALAHYEQVGRAFCQASAQAPDHPQYRVSCGHAQWLISTYYNSCDPDQQAPEAERQAYMAMIRRAIDEIGQGIALAGPSPGALDQSLGSYYAEQGQLEYILYTCGGSDKVNHLQQAIAYYTQAIEAEPDNLAYYHQRGRLVYALATNAPPGSDSRALTFEQAVGDLERAQIAAPDNVSYKTWLDYAARAGASSYFELGLARLARREAEAARQDYVRGVSLALKAEAARRRDTLDAAIEDLNRLAQAQPGLQNDIQAIVEMLMAARAE